MKRGYKNLPVGESHHSAKLTESDVIKLREFHQRGVCIRCVINLLELNVSYASAWEAVNYQTWRHVKEHTNLLKQKIAK